MEFVESFRVRNHAMLHLRIHVWRGLEISRVDALISIILD